VLANELKAGNLFAPEQREPRQSSDLFGNARDSARPAQRTSVVPLHAHNLKRILSTGRPAKGETRIHGQWSESSGIALRALLLMMGRRCSRTAVVVARHGNLAGRFVADRGAEADWPQATSVTRIYPSNAVASKDNWSSYRLGKSRSQRVDV